MNLDRLNFWLAILTFLGSMVVLIVARSAVRRGAVGRISDIARALTLDELHPHDPEVRSWMERHVPGIHQDDRIVVWVLRGRHEDRAVVVIGIHERSSRKGPRRSSDDRDRWIDRMVRFRNRRSTVPSVANQVLVLLVEALPGLPEFRIGPALPASSRGGGKQRASRARSVVNRPASVLFEGLTIEPKEAVEVLPPSFLDQAARVLVGRRQPWTIEGFAGLLSVRIARWRSSSRVRSYRAVIDEALSLRSAWEVRTDRSDDAETHRSIRSALKRIRQASEPSEPGGESLQGDRD